MSIILDLMRIDAVARAHGCGLHPRLRAAMQADQSWPGKAASPERGVEPGRQSGNVVPFLPRAMDRDERSA